MNDKQIKKLKTEAATHQARAGFLQGVFSQVWYDLFPESKVDFNDVDADTWDAMYQEFRSMTPTDTMHKYRNQCEAHEQEIISLKAQLALHDTAIAAELELKDMGVPAHLIDKLKKGK